jgi:pSer/pThr/pTyr-binding forkhead associated (FHA) protein
MASRVRFRDAQGREGVIELENEPVYVGRAPDCAIRSDDAMVSRRHSRIKRDGPGYWIEDLDSSNGTKVNGTRVQKHQLKNDDAVICGSLTLLYIEDALPVPPPAALAPAAGSTPPAPPGHEVEMQKLRDSVESLRLELDEARDQREKEVAENMRLRAEHLRFKQRLEDAEKLLGDAHKAVEEHQRIIEDLRPEIEKAIADRDQAAMDLSQAKQKVASLDRQLERLQEEASKADTELKRHKKTIADLNAAKEDGFKKLNEQVAELEQVRQVVREQELMLEQRRVGLINLEETVKDLRGKSDLRTRETAQLRAERDELRNENQQLARQLQELHAGGGSSRA